MIYCFDLDGTLCTKVNNSKYQEAIPDTLVINYINNLYNNGNIIKIMTARGSVSGIDYTDLTKSQLQSWGVLYNELIMNKKPHADLFIDDRGINIDEWKLNIPVVRGILAGSFDLLHPGYIRMFQYAKTKCNHLTVALHSNPNIENNKIPMVQSLSDRKEILESIKYIDKIICYDTEKDLYDIIATGSFDLRFLGSDYMGKIFTGSELPIKIEWIDRSHSYSTTNLKMSICQKNGKYFENK